MPTATLPIAEQRSRIAEARYADYERHRNWEERLLGNHRLSVIRYLYNDVRSGGRIFAETWRLVDDELQSMTAESLQARHTRIDRYRFDGTDIVVSEATSGNPRITLRPIYQNGLQSSRERAKNNPDFAFQARRDELFMRLYEEVITMMRQDSDCDTLVAVSTLPYEASPDALRELSYDMDEGKSFLYMFHRLPDNQLEMSATTLYSSNLAAHAALLRSTGQYVDEPLEMLASHEYGRYIVRLRTGSTPINHTIRQFVGVYDAKMRELTSKEHNYGRTDQSVDAYTLFGAAEQPWAALKGYYEMLARHFAGSPLHHKLEAHLRFLVDGQKQLQRLGKPAVLSSGELDRLGRQLEHGTLTLEMAEACNNLFMYTHIAHMDSLLQEFNRTGSLALGGQAGSGADLLDAYTSSAGGAGFAAAAEGRSYGGCEVSFGLSQSSLSQAMAAAAKNGTSLEEELRRITPEQGKAIPCKCPFCNKTVKVDPCADQVECPKCEALVVRGKVISYGKVYGQRTMGKQAVASAKQGLGREDTKPVRSRPSSGSRIRLGQETYTYVERVVVGGTESYLIDGNGAEAFSGKQARSLLGMR